MFSWKKKPAKERPTRSRSNLPVAVPGFGIEKEDDEEDLEAELLAMTGGVKSRKENFTEPGDDDDDLEAELAAIIGVSKSKKKKVNENIHVGSTRKRQPQQTEKLNLEAIGTELSIDDEDIDENDEELLNELKSFISDDEPDPDDAEEEEADEVIPSQYEIIKARLEKYKEAERKAKAANESSRVRRFNRGVKSLVKLEQRSAAGEIIPNDEIPPDISITQPAQPKPQILDDTTRFEDKGPALPPAPNVSKSGEPVPSEQDDRPAVKEGKNIPSPDVLNTENTGLPNVSEQTPSATMPEIKPSITTPEAEESKNAQFQPEGVENSVIAKPVSPHSNDDLTKSIDLAKVSLSDTVEIQSSTDEVSSLVTLLKRRRDEYKIGALAAKKEGNMPTALERMRVVKSLDILLETAIAGGPVDEKSIPPPPTPAKRASNVEAKATSNVLVPTTILDALIQRRDYYASASQKFEMSKQLESAKKFANVTRVYQNAITLHKAGKKVPYEKLPTPPGYPPIPIGFSF